MATTDYNLLSNTELDHLVAEKVMGWHLRTSAYGDWWADSAGHDQWPAATWCPTVNAIQSACLLRHLWESERFDYISRHTVDGSNLPSEPRQPMSCVVLDTKLARWQFRAEIPYADDPNGFRPLCIAALMAYEAEVNK